MEVLRVIAFILAVSRAEILEAPLNSINNDDRYIIFIGDDATKVTIIDTSEPVDHEFVEMYTSDPNNNGYWLYTRANPEIADKLEYNNETILKNSHFNMNKTTVFISHGWEGSGNSQVNTLLTKAFLDDQDINVIVIDWSALAAMNYFTAVAGVPKTGRGVGQFIKWLVSLGVSYENLHLVGFSLGGHIVGNAGKETEGNITRITALDPAGPLWLFHPEKLNYTDGKYVEVIHTTILAGHFLPCGHTDFYPNGGIIQPGCSLIDLPCAHSRAYEFMGASITKNNFKAHQCSNMLNMLDDKCSGDIEVMGNSHLNAKRPGMYRVNISGQYPFEVKNVTPIEDEKI